MSGAVLQSELAGLIQESKRKHPNVKAAAEKSLSDLKTLPVTSETQLAGDLLRKPSFIEPFVLACKSRNAKLVTSSIVCLQRLVASHAIPSERLKDVLEAFREVTSSGFDVQIKILQTLPLLLQTYVSDSHGALLFSSLELCGALQSSKLTVVSSTACATLQQLLSSAFERIADEDAAADSETQRELRVGDETIRLGSAAIDGFEIFDDLCGIADGVRAKRLQSRNLSLVFVLDLITMILVSNETVFPNHFELLFISRSKLMPALLRRLTGEHPFPVTIRSFKILYLLISRHLGQLPDECEAALGLLIHFLDPGASQGWKRTACMEVLRNIILNFPLLRQIFIFFDMKEDRKDIVSNMMAAFAKVAAEKPKVIGLSHQSTMPARQTDVDEEGKGQASLEAAGMEGVIGSTVTAAESHISGIGAAWSLPKTPCLEQLDKNDAPSLPDTYIYTLVLDFLSSFSEGLAKLVMPMSIAPNESKWAQTKIDGHLRESDDKSVSSDESKSIVPITATKSQKTFRPADHPRSTSHSQSDPVKTAVALVTSCWPAYLATCATFLNAALDAQFYHGLVRAIQKLAQVAGVLELSTPRDAFLTTLAKAAVPPRAPQISPATDTRKVEQYPVLHSSESAGPPVTNAVGNFVVESRISNNPDLSLLTTRNLLCSRALLNLGIALGPTLGQEAWFILLETLQEVEHLIRLSSRLLMNQNESLAEDLSSNEPSASRANLGGEIAAVQAASKKMFASSANYENDSFLCLLKALFSLYASPESMHSCKDIVSPTDSSKPRHVGRLHQPSRSTSGSSIKAAVEDKEALFVLTRTSEMARVNLQRFIREPAVHSGWSLVTVSLLQVIRSSITISDTRLRAANLLNTIVLGTMQTLDEEDEHLQREVQNRGVSVLKDQIEGLYQDNPSTSERRNCDLDIHECALQTLLFIVEQHGENLLVGWKSIIKLTGTVFEEHMASFQSNTQQDVQAKEVRARSLKLIKSAFRLLQLIGSDFLSVVPLKHLLDFIDILLLFSCQHDDLNISLTSTAFFWNLADFLHLSQGRLSLSEVTEVATQEYLVDQIQRSEDPKSVCESLWFVLLLRLNILTTDSRPEVRNNAIRVMLHILDASGPSLSPPSWHVCLSVILMRLLKSHVSLLGMNRQKSSDNDLNSLKEWYASTVALLEGSINLVCHFIHTIAADKRFLVFWEQLFVLLGTIVTTSSLAVSFATFQGVALLFSALEKASYRNGHAGDPALRLWIQCHPADLVDHSNIDSGATKDHDYTQDAFTAHAAMLVRVTDALPSVALDQLATKDILRVLRRTILRCVHHPHESDVLRMASEQERVIDILQLFSETRTSAGIEYYETLVDFIQVAFKDEADFHDHPNSILSIRQGPTSRNARTPSFVAFASKCIDILERDVIRTVQQQALMGKSMILRLALNVLSDTIKAKYSARTHRGHPLLWHKATASAIAIVEAVGSQSYNHASQEESLAMNEVYGSAITLPVGIIGSGGLNDMDPLPDLDAVAADERHDMAAFRRLSSTLIQALTELKDSDVTIRQCPTSEIHRKFVISLFHASMIAAPQYADLPSDRDLFSSPLSSLLRVRPGTIKELVYYIRSNIPYLALDTMFKLIAAFDSDKMPVTNALPGHMELARTAAPYVLLRAAHTLKSFIADQPLRGPMPMPSKLRAEMLYILRLCLGLRSEDEAFIGKRGSHDCLCQDGRKHLRVLYPLILRTWKVWRRVPRYTFSWITDHDGVEIEKCLHRWMEVCGENWVLTTSDT